MANEIAVPLLPCRSIDEMADFYTDARFPPDLLPGSAEPVRVAQARGSPARLLRHAGGVQAGRLLRNAA